MILENKLGLTSPSELAREEERISKRKAIALFESGLLDKEDYLLAMERNPIRDIEIKRVLRGH